jgi:flavin reductase (DIM6/NTAB) family NADH-FMN oxidoreductase RutF
MDPSRLVTLDTSEPIWDRFFSVSPLVLIGSREADGSFDLAPKHMVTPMGWANYFGFVCTPRHRTYSNIARTGAFTVSYPRPSRRRPAAAKERKAKPLCRRYRRSPRGA